MINIVWYRDIEFYEGLILSALLFISTFAASDIYVVGCAVSELKLFAQG